MSEDKLQHAREQAQAQFESIREMVEALNACDDDTNTSSDRLREEAQQRIHEDALEVCVRSAWHTPGREGASNEGGEYRIVLCTGGPAVQITGELNEHGEPETARLEMQDWFTPWMHYQPEVATDEGHAEIDEILLTYARQFYFGE